MIARISIASRRLPRTATTVVRRAYSSGRSDGSVASSKEFGKKERAVEDQYARQHESEQLRKLKEQIAKKKEELNELEQHAEEASKTK